MLHTEEVDDDYFTPVAGTSLASIFGNTAINKESTENDSLKYTPPKSQDFQNIPKEEKTTQCVFACALIGHEWSNNVYTSRGKLGFAILRIQNTGDHNIILYDSNKTTLSCTTVSPKLELSIKNDSYISYYDNLLKYWSIYAAKEEIKIIIEILARFGATVNYSTFTDTCPPEPINIEESQDITSAYNGEIESDSSANRKTKTSILNRMANMGHSVFPSHSTKPIEKTSDSSDTNEANKHPKILRHKTVKNPSKRYKDPESNPGQPIEFQHNMNEERNTQLCTSQNRQLLPTTTNIYANPCSNLPNEMAFYMTEQRMSNSELRINMNRISDKLDLVLNKVDNSTEHRFENVQTEILMKLVNEYEKKIEMYENILSSKDTVLNVESKNSTEVDLLKRKIEELELDNKGKCSEILSLHDEIKEMKLKSTEFKNNQANCEESFKKKICDLENTLAMRNVELKSTVHQYDSLQSNLDANELSMGNKLKNIMNDTYQTISVNFENCETYSGEIVKKVIGSVIKKITIQTLCDSS